MPQKNVLIKNRLKQFRKINFEALNLLQEATLNKKVENDKLKKL